MVISMFNFLRTLNLAMLFSLMVCSVIVLIFCFFRLSVEKNETDHQHWSVLITKQGKMKLNRMKQILILVFYFSLAHQS